MKIARITFATSLISTLGLLSCGSSNSDDPAALCRQGCEKGYTLCAPDAGPGADLASAARTACVTGCSNPTTNPNVNTCTNSGAILAAGKACLNQTSCEGLQTCFSQVPACMNAGSAGTGGAAGGASGTSTGGLSGTAGRAGGGASGTGTGGSSGGAGAGGTSGGTCADLLACCNASTNPSYKAVCMANYSSVMAMGNSICAMVLTAIKPEFCPTL